MPRRWRHAARKRSKTHLRSHWGSKKLRKRPLGAHWGSEKAHWGSRVFENGPPELEKGSLGLEKGPLGSNKAPLSLPCASRNTEILDEFKVFHKFGSGVLGKAQEHIVLSTGVQKGTTKARKHIPGARKSPTCGSTKTLWGSKKLPGDSKKLFWGSKKLPWDLEEVPLG